MIVHRKELKVQCIPFCMGIFYSPSGCVHLFVLNVTLVLHFGISAATPQPHDREFSNAA